MLLSITTAQACDDGHWLQENLADGRILKLDDGSVWKVAPFDAITSSLWLVMDDLIVCDDKLIHVNDGEEVEAEKLR
ncbi:MAG: hypothetical protein Q7J32_15870 [Sphingomonadaceae bacterium]|nr:hypothetical protein [Sphingomonadaceae bacterium]